MSVKFDFDGRSSLDCTSVYRIGGHWIQFGYYYIPMHVWGYCMYIACRYSGAYQTV